MSDSSKELQDEVPSGQRYYVFALKGTSWARAGNVLYKTFGAALLEAKKLNDATKVLHALRRAAPQPMAVFAVYPSKKSTKFHEGKWWLEQAMRAYPVTADDALAFSVEEAFAKGSP